jgi:hypothetical protein
MFTATAAPTQGLRAPELLLARGSLKTFAEPKKRVHTIAAVRTLRVRANVAQKDR